MSAGAHATVAAHREHARRRTSPAALVALFGPANALYANAVCFALSIVPDPGCSCRATRAPRRRRSTPDRRILRAARRRPALRRARTPLVRAVVILVVITNMVDAAGLTVLKPVYARGLGDDGAILGVDARRLRRRARSPAPRCSAPSATGCPRHGLFVVLFLLAGVPPYLTLALGAPLPVVFIVLALSGLAAGPINPLIDTALFGLIPVAAARTRARGDLDRRRGRHAARQPARRRRRQTPRARPPSLFVAAGVYLAAILSTSFGRRWHGF